MRRYEDLRHGHAVRDLCQEARPRQPEDLPRQGQVPRRGRQEDHRHHPAGRSSRTSSAIQIVLEGEHRPHAGLRPVHPQRPDHSGRSSGSRSACRACEPVAHPPVAGRGARPTHPGGRARRPWHSPERDAMCLTLDQVRKVAKLARLELAEADLARMQPQLGRHPRLRRPTPAAGHRRRRADGPPAAGPERVPRRRAVRRPFPSTTPCGTPRRGPATTSACPAVFDDIKTE